MAPTSYITATECGSCSGYWLRYENSSKKLRVRLFLNVASCYRFRKCMGILHSYRVSLAQLLYDSVTMDHMCKPFLNISFYVQI